MSAGTTRDCWIILGASSSISRAFARIAVAEGADIILAGRDGEDIDRLAADLRVRGAETVETRPFDITDFDDHEAFAEACRKEGRRLNLFLAAGTMAPQAEADDDFEVARRMIDANYTGAVSILSAFRPMFEAQQGGRIVVLGSVAGDRGRPSNHLYGSTKAGLHAYLSGLCARLHGKGVTVTTIKPGLTDTAMTWGMKAGPLFASPEASARASWKAAAKGRPVAYVPVFWWGIMTIIRLIPHGVFKRLKS